MPRTQNYLERTYSPRNINKASSWTKKGFLLSYSSDSSLKRSTKPFPSLIAFRQPHFHNPLSNLILCPSCHARITLAFGNYKPEFPWYRWLPIFENGNAVDDDNRLPDRGMILSKGLSGRLAKWRLFRLISLGICGRRGVITSKGVTKSQWRGDYVK